MRTASATAKGGVKERLFASPCLDPERCPDISKMETRRAVLRAELSEALRVLLARETFNSEHERRLLHKRVADGLRGGCLLFILTSRQVEKAQLRVCHGAAMLRMSRWHTTHWAQVTNAAVWLERRGHGRKMWYDIERLARADHAIDVAALYPSESSREFWKSMDFSPVEMQRAPDYLRELAPQKDAQGRPLELWQRRLGRGESQLQKDSQGSVSYVRSVSSGSVKPGKQLLGPQCHGRCIEVELELRAVWALYQRLEGLDPARSTSSSSSNEKIMGGSGEGRGTRKDEKIVGEKGGKRENAIPLLVPCGRKGDPSKTFPCSPSVAPEVEPRFHSRCPSPEENKKNDRREKEMASVAGHNMCTRQHAKGGTRKLENAFHSGTSDEVVNSGMFKKQKHLTNTGFNTVLDKSGCSVDSERSAGSRERKIPVSSANADMDYALVEYQAKDDYVDSGSRAKKRRQLDPCQADDENMPPVPHPWIRCWSASLERYYFKNRETFEESLVLPWSSVFSQLRQSLTYQGWHRDWDPVEDSF